MSRRDVALKILARSLQHEEDSSIFDHKDSEYCLCNDCSHRRLSKGIGIDMPEGTRELTNWIDGFMDYTEDIVESPSIFRKWVAISVLASAMQRKCYMPFGVDTIYPNLYIILVGPSGIRKNTAMKPGRQLIESVKIALSPEATTKERLIMRMKEVERDPVFDGKTLHLDSSLTIHSNEVVVLIGHKDPEFLSHLCDWYDCHPMWKYETKTAGKYEINKVWVNLLGGITPSLLNTSLPQEAIGGGFTSRVIFVYADKLDKFIPIPTITEKEILLRSKLEIDLAHIRTLSGMYTMSDDFVDGFIKWASEQQSKPRFDDPKFAGYDNRRRWHLLKLCMILHTAVSDDKIINSDDLEYAIRMMDEVEKDMEKTFSGVGKLDEAGIISEILLSLEVKKVVTIPELMNKYIKDLHGERILEIIKTICDMGYAQHMIEGKQQWLEYIPRD